MHPYAGNPANFPPAVDILDDSDAPNAANFNTPHQGLLDRTAYLYARIGHVTALNWTPEFAFAGGVVQQAVQWDPVQNEWMLLYTDGGGLTHLEVTLGLDLGAAAAWTSIGTDFSPATAASYASVVSDPTTAARYWVPVVTATGANNAFEIWHWTGSAWTDSPGAWTSTVATGTYYGTGAATLNGYVILAVSGTSAGDSFIVASNNAFATWVSAASSAGGSIVIPPCTGAGLWYLKANGTQCVAIQGGGAAGLFHVYQSTDGHTWTDSSSLATLMATLAPGGNVVGLAWTQDSGGPCWVVAVETVTAHVVFARSPDGLVWTPQTGGLTSQQAISDMASAGGALVCTLDDQSSGGPSGTIFSVDGGVTWYPCPANFTSNVTTLGARSRIAESPTGFFMANGKFARFSSLSGLPPMAL